MDTNKLSGVDLQRFYALLLFYERVVKPHGFVTDKWENEMFNEFCTNNGIRKKVDKDEFTGKNVFSFNKRKELSVSVSFLKHIRDAFAHGMITKMGNDYIIDNHLRKTSTMDAVIKADLLWGMIEILADNSIIFNLK